MRTPSLKSLARLVLTFAMLAGSVASARTDKPMTFSIFYPCSGNSCAARVLASGVIQQDSARKFAEFLAREKSRSTHFIDGPVIAFDSPGGSLTGGIELGKFIRNRKFKTELAQMYKEVVLSEKHSDIEYERVVAENVICASACALAFIGGVTRSIEEGSKFGVHQFASTKGNLSEGTTQVTVTLLAAYVNEMGASRQMIDFASLTSAAEISWLTTDQVRALNIDNVNHALNPWKVVVDKSGSPSTQVFQPVTPGHEIAITITPEIDEGFSILIVSFFSLSHFQEARLKQFPIGVTPKISFKIGDSHRAPIVSLTQWRLTPSQSTGKVAFLTSGRLQNSEINNLRRASSLEISEDISNALLDLSITTSLSTENLEGAISLLRRAK